VSDPFRNLRLYWHRARKTARITLDGVTVRSGPDQARAVRNGLYKRSYEAAERALVGGVLRPGDTVLEIGAGVGFVGLLCARLVTAGGAAGRVVSYEANSALAPVIAANYALNAAQPELRMRAITVDGAPVTFHTSDNVVSSSLYERAETQRKVTVESTALAEALAEIAPDVMVMDVEGAEADLLATGDLAPLRAAVIEMHPHIVGAQRIAALERSLAARGWQVTARRDLNVVLERDGA
jgi:FkbM family methyltransferase